ncbi:MAG: hypothetical protein JWP34_559 [Massilia sp.]|nr:hypothetical protein [Massilia sp.]
MPPSHHLKGFTVRRLVPTFLACALCAPAAQAYRPFDGTDAAVADAGVFELELGAIHQRRGSGRSIGLPAFTANFGFEGNTEIVFDGRLNRLLGESDGAPRSSFGDAVLSVKHVFREGSLQEKSGPSVAAECGLLLPGLRADSGSGATCAGIVSQQLDAVAVHLNASLTRSRENEHSRYLGAIVEGPDRWAVRPVMEAGTERSIEGGRTHSVLVGAIWKAGRDLTLDVGLRKEHGTEQKATEIRFGLTWSMHL